MSLWDGHRVPMTFLGGYLGAGKTTIVNRALAATEDRRIAVLVNDVGAVAVDAALVAERHPDTIELTNGCVCCSMVDGFAVALEQVRGRVDPPDHVLIELSGVAEPARVVPWASTAGFRFDGVVVAADAEQVTTRIADPRVGSVVADQLRTADVVALTKVDLVESTAPVRSLIGEFTEAPLVEVREGCLGLDVLLGSAESSDGPIIDHGRPADAATAWAHVTGRVRVSGRSAEDVAAVVEALHPDVVRVKGFVATPAGAWLVERVGSRTSARPVAGGDWPEGLVVVALSAEGLAEAREALS